MAANKIGAKLDIVGRTYPENNYFKDEVIPHLNDKVRVLEVGREELPKLYGRAKALLFPILWEEPFGLVMVEAMACGTPVIAFRHGSVPEVVKDGVTGFIVDNVDEMAKAMKEIDKIDRRACRRWVEENFSVERMTAGYEALFQDLVKNRAG